MYQGLKMKKILIACIAVLALVGCQGGDTTNTQITNVEMGDNGTYIYNADGTVTYIDYNNGESTDGGAGTTGTFNATDNAVECRLNGYFFCTLSNSCTNQPLGGGTCTSR